MEQSRNESDTFTLHSVVKSTTTLSSVSKHKDKHETMMDDIHESIKKIYWFNDSSNMILIHYFMIFKIMTLMIQTWWYRCSVIINILMTNPKQSMCLHIHSLMWICYIMMEKSQWSCISFFVFERNQTESVQIGYVFFCMLSLSVKYDLLNENPP